MRATVIAVLALGLLCTATEAFTWRSLLPQHPHRHLLQLAAGPKPEQAAAIPVPGAAAQPPAAAAATPQQPGAVREQAAAPDAAAAGGGAPAAAAPAAPKVLRPGVYVIEDPPPAPKVVAAPAAANATANATKGPQLPAAGKNLMVVMTVMGQEAKDIYKNQGQLKSQLADAAGVSPSQIFFYNQTANMDPRTGVTALSLVMNVDCTDQMQCAKAGGKLVNSTSQTKLTDSLSRSSISLLPGTFQVYGVNAVGRYKGNDTLFENKALTVPKAATVAPDYNATMARFNTAKPTKNGTAAALPGQLPLGNFTIPDFNVEYDNFTLSESPMTVAGEPTAVVDNATLFQSDIATAAASSPEPSPEPAAPAPKSAAGAASVFAAVPLLAAAAALLLL